MEKFDISKSAEVGDFRQSSIDTTKEEFDWKNTKVSCAVLIISSN